MKKFLLGLLLASHLWAMDKCVEEYTNKSPKIKFAFSFDMSAQKKKDKDSQVTCDINEIFAKINADRAKTFFNFKSMEIDKIDLVYTDPSYKKYIYVHIQHIQNSSAPMFLERQGFSPSSVYKSNKWTLPDEQNLEDFIPDKAMEMSWKWIDIGLHEMTQYITNKSRNIFFENLYKTIHTSTLQQSINRIIVTHNQKRNYLFYAAFDSKKEKERVFSVLNEIEATLH